MCVFNPKDIDMDKMDISFVCVSLCMCVCVLSSNYQTAAHAILIPR